MCSYRPGLQISKGKASRTIAWHGGDNETTIYRRSPKRLGQNLCTAVAESVNNSLCESAFK